MILVLFCVMIVACILAVAYAVAYMLTDDEAYFAGLMICGMLGALSYIGAIIVAALNT